VVPGTHAPQFPLPLKEGGSRGASENKKLIPCGHALNAVAIIVASDLLDLILRQVSASFALPGLG
jgi:hypothetical protein